MKTTIKFLFGAFSLFAITGVKAQGFAVSGTNTYTNPLTNNVGIATNAPQAKLHVNGDIAAPYGFTMFHYEPSFSAAYQKMPYFRRGWSNTIGDYLYLSATGNNNSTNEGAIICSGNTTRLMFGTGSSTADQLSTTFMVILSNGNVGIGTKLINNPNNYKLAVNGTIGAKGLKVELSTTTWADYVFNTDYKLKTIAELESFIKANHHLPNVPSTQEVEKNGIDMASMNATLLEKIEELSLYIIEQNKRIEALEKAQKN